ncbi:MAG: transcription elongation factor GreA [Bacteroidales bacterium]|jgi:transcription elongation factor GreA|nr:transcription elongation factor GreA [Bacteroidales bacterium]MDI9545894.1 transcription elongation factor GreA [Bacteroidota bacterium]OQC03726.1 MAG: Transcription elongation factor GreA [Bacteroidetes bacterium ADurb.Bin090]MBP8981910.1 transcription elongation factor GreA [Bacteroidales bacterium]NLV38091.1 transcription elongation factor GreA [Bacteroidales bacterium]
MATNYMTENGLNKLKEELEHLETVERAYISKQIAEARDKGDLSENAEYEAAKDAQGMLEMKIANIKELIRNARILDESKISTDTVQILTNVHLLNLKTNQEIQYTIVPDNEANLREKKISVSSPVAQGLFGKKEGEVVDIEVPAGIITYRIKKIEHAK